MVAYFMEESQTTSNQALVSRRFVVQHTVTRHIMDSISLADIAYIVYRETDSGKIPAAVQSLGQIVSLAFYDVNTLYWSGMSVADAEEEASKEPRRWQTVVIQTSNRVLLWNIRRGPGSHSVLYPSRKMSHFKRLLGVLHESTLGGNGAIPSSNLLPLTETTVLVGCSDGSLKSYDWSTKTVVKSIKGLGSNDWIVKLLPANKYSVVHSGEKKRRILTLTKKGVCYLIELTISGTSVDIEPPLARFSGGLSEVQPESHMQHCPLTFDAHRDLVFWLATPPKTKNTSMLVWDLKALQTDLLKQIGGRSLFKPDPTVTIQVPSYATESTANSSNTTVFPILHAAFAEDTIVLASASYTSGDFHIIASVGGTNTAVNQVIGTSVTSMALGPLIQAGGGLDFTPLAHITGIQQAPLLAASENSLMLVSSLGLVFLELPATATTATADSCHVHFGAGLGSLGKAVLSVQDSSIIYGSLDVLKANPVGRMVAKNPVVLHESPAPMHLPPEFHKKPFRLAPRFLTSPSGMYLAIIWPSEFRYEILHISSLLQKVGTRSSKSAPRNPVVASGTGMGGFAWLGDDDSYAVIRDKNRMAQAVEYMMTPLAWQKAAGEDSGHHSERIFAKNVAKLATSVTKSATHVATSAVSKTASSGMMAATKATSVGLKATKAATNATKNVTKFAAKTAAKGVKKATFGLFKRKKNKDGDSNTAMSHDDDFSESEEASELGMTPSNLTPMEVSKMPERADTQNRPYVELHYLEAVEVKSSEGAATIPAATSTPLGKMTLRGGNRNLPVAVYGGPVLCVATKAEENGEGSAHFYTRKADDRNTKAGEYVASGPTLPLPDLVVWDDDGIYCAVIAHNRVLVYLSEAPSFALMGTVRVGLLSQADSRITSARFVHGVLYCCTVSSVHCVFLGDSTKVCRLDTYVVASTELAATDARSSGVQSRTLMPTATPLPLLLPVVLGYQSGSLVVSTVRGIYTVPLTHPLIRIGSLLAAGQEEAAMKWFHSIPDSEHEALSAFLERRGCPHLSLALPSISLETTIDISMRHGYVGRLEEVVEVYGVKGLSAIDSGRGVSASIYGLESGGNSIVVTVGAYLLAHGRVELARRLATECLRSGEDGKKDALVLAALLLSVDEDDATRLINRAVENAHPDTWLLGAFVKNHLLADRA
jgi:hypothetical protein